MKFLENLLIRKETAIILVLIGFILAIVFTFFGGFVYFQGRFNPQIFSHYGNFVGGIVGPLLSLSGFIIIYLSFNAQIKQQKVNINRQNENVLFKLIENLNDYRVYSPGRKGTTTYHSFFIDFYTEILEGDDSLLGLYERDEATEDLTNEFRNKLNDYNAYTFDFVRRVNNMIDYINEYLFDDQNKYISILFNHLGIFEIFYLKTMTIRMLERGTYTDKKGLKKHQEHCRDRLYNFLTENKFIPSSLMKNDTRHYPIYFRALKNIEIEIPMVHTS